MALTEGFAEITATTANGISATCEIEVLLSPRNHLRPGAVVWYDRDNCNTVLQNCDGGADVAEVFV
jgi:hypothetical protein